MTLQLWCLILHCDNLPESKKRFSLVERLAPRNERSRWVLVLVLMANGRGVGGEGDEVVQVVDVVGMMGQTAQMGVA